jgi:hypothetical protein
MHNGAERCHFEITHRGNSPDAPRKSDDFWV